MHLYHYVIIAITIVSIFCAESTPNRDITPPQRFIKRDEGAYFGYNLKHIYTTLKPHEELYILNKYRNKNEPPKTDDFAKYSNIQFAPLPLKSKELHIVKHITPQEEDKEVEISTEASSYKRKNVMVTQQERDKKSYIMPQSDSTVPYNILPLKHVPHTSNDNLDSVNNKLKQNEFYASNSNLLVKNEQVNITLLQQHQLLHQQQQLLQQQQELLQQLQQQKQQLELLQQQANHNKAITNPLYSVMIPYKYSQFIKKHNGKIPAKTLNNVGRPFFYVKASKLHLNLARHVARTLPKATVNFNSSFRKFPSLPQEFFSQPHILEPPKTVLYPLKKQDFYDQAHLLTSNV